MRTVCLFLLSFLLSFTVPAQPARKAWLGGYGSFSARGLSLDSVAAGSTLHLLQLRKGDTLTKINSRQITDAAGFNAIAGDLRTGDPIVVGYRRGGKQSTAQGRAVMRPYDTSAIAEVIYGWVPSGTCMLRSIVRKPKREGRLPAVLLVPGYNCGSIENYNRGSYGALIRSWLQNGFVVVTVEKSGLGDSYGCQPCMEADLVSDIRGFDAGYRYMEGLPFVDTGQLFIWGHSMGGIVAPEVARRHHPRGVIAFATVFRPWSEFLPEMHRVQFPLDGKTYAETEDRVRGLQKIYYEFFRLGKSPAELYRNPEYRDLVTTELEYREPYSNNMWGRHWRFWQQIDSLDMARSWSAVTCPVLSVFGGADFIACSELEHELITRTVNAAHPGNATHITIPDVDHLIVRNPDRVSAHRHFADKAYREANFHQGFADTVNAWMKRQLAN